MSTARQMWFWAVFLPVLTFVAATMCVWPAPRFLGLVAEFLLWLSVFTFFLFSAAIPAVIWFAIVGLASRKQEGELVRRASQALACLAFAALWIVAFWWADSVRHRAFVRASQAGNRIVQALDRYRIDHGEYPETLAQLRPGYLEDIPYTGMIAYPEFKYRRDYHDLQPKPGEYELRIDCSSGWINWDRFIYWPSEEYPDQIQGNGVERMGTWAYVHE